MTDTPTMVALDEASYASLKHYAEVHMGIAINHGTNGAQLRGKILQANPDVTEIPHVEEAAPRKPKGPVISEAEPGARSKYGLNQPGNDPKVRIIIDKTIDSTRAKEVTLSAGGYVCRAQRGVAIDVPYRIFKVLDTGIEKRAVLSDREGPFGMPQYDYEEVHSYPFRVLAMPSDEEIEAFELATNNEVMKAA